MIVYYLVGVFLGYLSLKYIVPSEDRTNAILFALCFGWPIFGLAQIFIELIRMADPNFDPDE